MSLFCYCCLKTSILFIVLVDGYPELQAGGTIFGKRIWIRGSNKPFVFPDLHSSIFWTVCKVVSEVSQVIVNKLWTLSVTKYMPNTEEEFKSKMLDMEEMRQFPSCWAAIDGCHIPIKCPPGGKNACKEYHNYKNFYSVVLMAFVDSHYCFIWASCGFPGNSHDSIMICFNQYMSEYNGKKFYS